MTATNSPDSNQPDQPCPDWCTLKKTHTHDAETDRQILKVVEQLDAIAAEHPEQSETDPEADPETVKPIDLRAYADSKEQSPDASPQDEFWDTPRDLDVEGYEPSYRELMEMAHWTFHHSESATERGMANTIMVLLETLEDRELSHNFLAESYQKLLQAVSETVLIAQRAVDVSDSRPEGAGDE